MTKTRNIYPPGHYEKYIQTNFTTDHCGINLEPIGNKDYDRIFPVDLDSTILFDRKELKREVKEIIDFVDNVYSSWDDKPIWYKINVIDQAINEYVGIGFLNRNIDWLTYIIDYLSNDRAEQCGDTILTVFDLDFNWAICFTLSQDDNCLRIEKFKK